MTATFTREQFDEACRKFIHAHQSTPPYQAKLAGWSWKEHNVRRNYIARLFYRFRNVQTLPGFGYMHRMVTLKWRNPESDDTSLEIDDGLDVADDGTTAPYHSPDPLTCQQYVVLSATFRVPTFYFSIHGSSTCG
jgi:ubiquitin-like-conjugating enzyme ATG10